MNLDEALEVAKKLDDNDICAMVYKYDALPGEEGDDYSEVERQQLTAARYGVHILSDFVTGDIIIAITEAT